jgi:hypothetical protein
MAACDFHDWRFGPQVHHSCRQFDFTLFFESIFLSAVPSAVLLICLFARLWRLVGSSVKVQGGTALLLKTVCGNTPGTSTWIPSTDFMHADQHLLAIDLAYRFPHISRHHTRIEASRLSCGQHAHCCWSRGCIGRIVLRAHPISRPLLCVADILLNGDLIGCGQGEDFMVDGQRNTGHTFDPHPWLRKSDIFTGIPQEDEIPHS